MTLPDRGVPCILLSATQFQGAFAFALRAVTKSSALHASFRDVLLSALQRVAGRAGKDGPRVAKVGVISSSQVLEAVWSRGCT